MSLAKIASRVSLIETLAATLWRRMRLALNPNSIYSRAMPMDQAAVDLFSGEWTCAIPEEGLITGTNRMFYDDPRPAFAERGMGEEGLRGKSLLELGPLEGAHTYWLERFGANVTAIEANQLAFQRCLIVKNILNLKAKFLLGDFVPYVAGTKDRYDLVFASGVLYHMQNPVDLLRDLCRISDNLYLWTHYYDEEVISRNAWVRKTFATGATKEMRVNDKLSITCHGRHYGTRFLTYFLPGFCGGMHMETYWPKLEDLLKCIEAFGFKVVATDLDPEHKDGPAIQIFARRER